jgi:hypothetical protein
MSHEISPRRFEIIFKHMEMIIYLAHNVKTKTIFDCCIMY